jgi:hypothetical protein
LARVRRDAKRYAFLPPLNSGELHVPANDVVGDAGVDLSLNIGGLLNRFRISLEALRDHFGLGEVTSQEENAELLPCASAGNLCHPSANHALIVALPGRRRHIDF